MPAASGLVYGVQCGDCRDLAAVERILDGRKVNLVITSPPYASQRKYDESSGFVPIPPDDYVNWYKDVARVIERILAPDGSYFLNIKAHSDDGERSLYVTDLLIAHKREWGWRFVDEFCWRNTANGVPGGWPNRFKNAWEPVYHFTRAKIIKFRPKAAGHQSERVVKFASDNPHSSSGSGLLRYGAELVSGLAWPSNVIEVPAESGEGEHSAPFPRALVEFFIKAFTDPGDIVFDPFMGSGTTAAAAYMLGRSCFGTELSPAYTDVIARRLQALATDSMRLVPDGQTFEQIREFRAQMMQESTEVATS